MKKIFLFAILFLAIGLVKADAQRVRVRMGFPAGAYLTAPGPAPYVGGIWIGPEWEWRHGRYEYIPGYWGRPRFHGAVWVPGYWRHARRGYSWVPGHWR